MEKHGSQHHRCRTAVLGLRGSDVDFLKHVIRQGVVTARSTPEQLSAWWTSASQMQRKGQKKMPDLASLTLTGCYGKIGGTMLHMGVRTPYHDTQFVNLPVQLRRREKEVVLVAH
jgi:hypothetical protein